MVGLKENIGGRDIFSVIKLESDHGGIERIEKLMNVIHFKFKLESDHGGIERSPTIHSQ